MTISIVTTQVFGRVDSGVWWCMKQGLRTGAVLAVIATSHAVAGQPENPEKFEDFGTNTTQVLASPPIDAEAIAHIRSGHTRLSELPLDLARKKEFIIAGLESPSAKEALSLVTPVMCEDRDIRDAIISKITEMPNNLAYLSREAKTSLANREDLRSSALSLPIDNSYSGTIWELIITYETNEAKGFPFMNTLSQSVLPELTKIVDDNSDSIVPAFKNLRPILGLPEIGKLFVLAISAGGVKELKGLSQFASKLNPEQFDSVITLLAKEYPEGLMACTGYHEAIFRNPTAVQAVVRGIESDPAKWVEMLREQQAPISICNAMANKIAANIAGAKELVGYTLDDSAMNTALSLALTKPEVKQAVLRDINLSIKYLVKYPHQILRDPTVQHAVRMKCDQIRGTLEAETLKEEFFADLAPYAEVCPSLLKLACHHSHFKGMEIYAKSAVGWRIETYGDMISNGALIPESVTAAHVNALVAAHTLNINTFKRFDDTREIIRQRFAVSSREVQAKLEKLLGWKYLLGIEDDKRPVCTIIAPAGEADHNGAFQLMDNHSEIAAGFDHLTTQYRVRYYEVSSEKELLDALKEASRNGTETSEVILIGAHGSQDGFQLGSILQIANGEKPRINTTDTSVFEAIGRALKPQGQIILQSCSTGKGGIGADNILTALAKAAPHSHIYAPDNDSGSYLRFDDTGKFIGPGYIGCNILHIKPGSSKVEITAGKSVTSILLQSILWDTPLQKYATTVTGLFAGTLFISIAKFAKRRVQTYMQNRANRRATATLEKS